MMFMFTSNTNRKIAVKVETINAIFEMSSLDDSEIILAIKYENGSIDYAHESYTFEQLLEEYKHVSDRNRKLSSI
jgi:uncharacterized membrane-anchored protein